MFDRLSGTMTFISYRDPNLLKTIDNFDRSVEFLRKVNLNDNELTKAIVGAIGHMDTYLLPDAKGYLAMLRHLTGDTEEERSACVTKSWPPPQRNSEPLPRFSSDCERKASSRCSVRKAPLLNPWSTIPAG